ncbi:MAG: hypothetical protein IPP66_14545 [Anaerolineales bacterium]|nr:hypothetical protein [Anaerolineales bacterium]
MSESRLPSASIENEFLRLEYLITTGPRIIGLYPMGVDGNLLAETPDIHWPVPHGEFYLRGGHRLWKAPEDSFYNCPEDGVTVIEGNGVTLRSPVDPSGLEKEIAVRLDGHRVHLSQKITWHGDKPITLAPWGITQLRLGGMGILPLSSKDGLAPNRNLVLWPYTSLKDDRLELHDDFILLHGTASEQAAKIGNCNTHGWIAYAMGNALFVKRFGVEEGALPDLNTNVQAYVRDVCIELETLGALKTLRNGESVTLNETWEVTVGEFPANLETARIIGDLLNK